MIFRVENWKKKERDLKDLFPKIPLWCISIIIIPSPQWIFGLDGSLNPNINYSESLFDEEVLYDVWLNKKGGSIERFPLFSWFYSTIDQTKILINNKLYELRSIKSISMQRFGPINLSIYYLINLGCVIMIKKGKG